MKKMNEQGKHAFLKPVVNTDICTGCGLCEKACVTEKPAIFVLPREVASWKKQETTTLKVGMKLMNKE